MREHGCIDAGSGLGADGHACWAFEGEEFSAAALEFLTDGLRAGQRLAYVGGEAAAEQRERLDPLGDVGSMIDTGMLQLFQLEDLYPLGEPIDCEAQLGTYAAAVDGALADGYTGLRVAAQVTDLVADPATWDAHVRWESVADRFMSVRPFSAMCGYRRDALPESLLAELAAVHPAANVDRGTAPFHLYGEAGELALAGEVDCFSAACLDRVLDAALGHEPASIDLGELDFIDHRGLEALAGHTRRLAESGCAVRNAPPVVDRLCDLLELQL